ncbi:hypothetical protein JCM8547_003221 [Rhodosporidiobolus lusitaniae]
MFSEKTLQLKEAQEPAPHPDDAAPFPTEPSRRSIVAIAGLISAVRAVSPSSSSSPGQSLSHSPSTDSKAVLTSSLPQNFLEPLPKALKEDSLGKKVLANPAAYPSFEVEDELLYLSDQHGHRLYVPKAVAPSFVEAVLSLAHETVGHQGPAKTLGWARRFFWWPQMHRDAYDYCGTCEPCARGKSVPAKPYRLLHPLEVPSRPWAVATVDFVVGLPPVEINGIVIDSILTATCPLSKMVVLMALPSTATAEDVATVIYEHVYKRFGSPVALVSDRDPKFTSDFWRALNKKVGISLKMSSSAHPETDGRSEVTNKSVGTVLRILCADSPSTWASKLPTVEFALNSAPASATGLCPFEVVYGFLPSPWPVDTWSPSSNAAVESRSEVARQDWLRATDAIISARVDMVHHSNKHRRDDSSAFVVGGKAYLSSAGLSFPAGSSRKFIPRYLGPFSIIAADPSKSNYTLALPPHLRIHPKFHASKLRPFFANNEGRFPSRAFAQPPSVLPGADAGGDAEWEIEKVVAVKTVGKRRMFQVRYLGYSASEDEWRPEAELRETAPELLDAFLVGHERSLAARESAPGRRRRSARLAAFLLPLAKPLASS